MATVKITDLPTISTINANTANTVLVGVDIPTNITGQMTLTTLANGLYSNNYLVVGDFSHNFPNAIAVFAGPSDNYIQTIIENTDDDGTADFVAQSNVSTDIAHFIDIGFTGNNYNNTLPVNSLGTSVGQLDGYLYVQGKEGAKGGNLVIGTASSNTKINFIVGGVNSQNIVAYMTTSGIYSPSIDSVVTANAASANSVVNTRISANVATLRGEITANAASANSVINSRITANIATANLFTQSAFDKANNALANTSGTFAGTLTVTGNVISKYGMAINNPTMPGNGIFLLITGSANNAYGLPSNPGYTIQTVAPDGQGNRIVAEAYGSSSTGYSSFIGRRARGTAESPSAVQANDVIVRIGGNGYGSTKFSQFSDARIEYVATETHTDTSKGTQIQFWTTPTGSNTASQIGVMNGNTVTFTGTVGPQKGFIYTPRILTGAQTAITIDFATDSMIRAEFNSTLTMSFANYTYGKVVEAWVTNTAGIGQTINLGVLSNNSTTGSSTLSIASNRSAKLQYFSINGDLANTFCAITYA